MDVDRLIEESIDALADDNPAHGAERLVDLAKAFAVTAMGQVSFNNIRYYIIEKPKERDQCPGVPTWVLKGERFWGKDRVDMLVERINSL